MTNDLRILKKELKSFAKRVKDFKYTDSALITFLLTGLIMLSGISLNLYSDEIKTQQEAINTSIFQLQKDFKRARQENNKLLRNTNLELIQLMEQGDHVVKSPWGSFQFGSNYVYNDWKGTYKGRGDKKEAIKYARENDKFGTYAGAKQGTTELKRVIEPISAVPVDAAVRPKDIRKTALNINLPNIGAPQKPNLNIRVGDPLRIEEMSVRTPTITVPPINPNAKPFIDFSFTRKYLTAKYMPPVPGNPWESKANGASSGNRSTIWNGYDPADSINHYKDNFGYSNVIGGTLTPHINGNASSSEYLAAISKRPDYTIYANNSYSIADNAFIFENINLYLVGNINGAGTVADNHDGVIGMHTVRNGKLRNITGYLYGEAAFLSIETWHSGKITLDNVDVNINGDENTIFYIYPARYEASTGYDNTLHAYHQRGGFTGSLDAAIKSNKNIVYSILGVSGSFGIKSDGTYKLEGSQNIVYSNTGYSPDFEKIASSSAPGAIAHNSLDTRNGMNFTPFINLSKPVESYGDGNILMFFSNQNNDGSTHTDSRHRISVWADGYGPNITYNLDSFKKWDKSIIGIYQGEVGVNEIIGEKLSIADDPT